LTEFPSGRQGHDAADMGGLTGDALLSLPLRLHGIQLGHAVDVLLDRETFRAVGLDILCGDDVHRFLPLPTATVSDQEIAILSPLVLLEEDELAFYCSRAFALSSLRGRPVESKRSQLGKLRDVVVAGDGELLAVLVGRDGRIERVPFGPSVRFAPASRNAA
jgi:hypothetical protein